MTADSDSACKNHPMGDLRRSGNAKFALIMKSLIFKKVVLNPFMRLVFNHKFYAHMEVLVKMFSLFVKCWGLCFCFSCCFFYPFGFRKVREAGSFHMSNLRPNPITGVRVMTPNPSELTSIKLTSIKV